MSRSTGVLAYKRVVCNAGKCKTFKIGMCIDVNVRKKVWASKFNDLNQSFQANKKAFATAAVAVLKANNDRVPSYHRCKYKQDRQLAKYAIMISML